MSLREEAPTLGQPESGSGEETQTPFLSHKQPNYDETTGKGIWGEWTGRTSLVLLSWEKEEEEPHSARAHGQVVSSAPPGIDTRVPRKQTAWKTRAGILPGAP